MHTLIIGGGIAGTATALALHKAGITSAIFEGRDSHSDGVGAFITLAVNGVTALRALGVDVRDIPGIPTTAMQLALGDGHQLTRFPLGPVLADGSMSRTIRRAELYSALRQRVQELGIPVHYDSKLVGADAPTGGPVTARFANGTAATGDLLVGADGLHSRTRAIIDPTAPAARYLGVLNAGGYARGLDLDVERGVMHMTFGRKTFFSFVAAEDGEVWWFANPPLRREPGRGELGTDGEAWRSTLLDLVADDTSPATEIIAASHQLFIPWPTHDFPNVPVWHRDGMIIIGDAAHAASPSSGQGASMAIEDAMVLALALRDQPSIPAAFAAYEAVRRPRVTRVVRQGKRNGNGKVPGPLGRAMRDRMLRLFLSRPPRNQNAQGWLYDYPIDWDAGIVAGTQIRDA